MTYYDEFGISPRATSEEIRKAHHTLSRLLHPDLQSDPQLRQMAEIQMRRLNDMVATLVDPIRRRAYDNGLVAAPVSIPPEPPTPPRKRGIFVFPGIVIAGVSLTAAILYFWAGDLIRIPNSTQSYVSPAAQESEEETASLPDPPRARRTARVPAAPAIPYEGLWVFVASRKSHDPERIELRISNDQGLLHGLYRTRYRLMTFMGPATGNDTSLALRAPDGTEGTIALRIAGPDILHVDWALKNGGGSAVLARIAER